MPSSRLRKWIPNVTRSASNAQAKEDDPIEGPSASQPGTEGVEVPVEPNGAILAAEQAEEAEAGQRSPFSAATGQETPPAGPLASHPVQGDSTPPRSISSRQESLRGKLPSTGPSSSASKPPRTPPSLPITAPASPAPANGTLDMQSHLRKVTANLVDILDSMSNASPNSSPAASSKDGTTPHRRAATIGSRGDSVATFVDVEAQNNSKPTTPEQEVVPAHHVRRLTNTLVDMLRSMHTSNTASPPADLSSAPLHEASALLGDGASEISEMSMDKYSVTTGGGSSTRDSEISAQTALLKAQYLPQPDYRGDEVRPFFIDSRNRALLASFPIPSDDGASGAGDKSDIAADGLPYQFATSAVAEEESDSYPLPRKLQKGPKPNWFGLTVFALYIIAFIIYIGIRSAKTLGLGGNLWYGVIVLMVEILGGFAMLPYGLCLSVKVPQPKDKNKSIDAAAAASKGQPTPTAVGYHIRVLIPCYKEPLDVISKTFMAAMYASLPANCRRTVYLLDDGRDADKKRFVRSLGMNNAVYVSGRKRAKGEMNGKSANINNACKQIYPEGVPIPLDEVLCVFDADQVPNADFFVKMVPKLDGGQDVAMVLSPQTFYNLNSDGDIFNHANVHFWDYTQPGYDALGLISCTGTNFLLRARAFQEAGWFPEWTLTEDFALGIELKRRGWQCCYVDEYLAVGEAPEEVRNCFQQRSRWAKGHFQVFFSKTHNPTFGAGGRGLSWLMKWLYGSVVLSYFSAFLGTPLLMLVPIITVWFGAFPIVINFWAALSITIYYGATLLLQYYAHSLGHLKSMWFASVSNSVLWWAFLKAMYRATIGRWLSGTIVFKVTAKGLQRLNKLPIRDIWMSTIWFIFSLVTLIFGLVHYFKGGVMDTPLIISLIFMVYNLVPQYLLLQYAVYRPRMFFNAMCRIAMLLSTAMAIMGVVFVWLLYPQDYDYQSALGSSLYFYDTQRVGDLPAAFRVTWRQDSFLADGQAAVYLAQNPNDTLLSDFSTGFGGGFGDPFGGSFGGSSTYGADPLSSAGSSDFFGSDPFGRRKLMQADDPFGAAVDAAMGDSSGGIDATTASDPFAVDDSASALPTDAFAASGGADPFAADSGAAAMPVDANGAVAADPFAAEPAAMSAAVAAPADLFADPSVGPTTAAEDPFGGDPQGAASADPFASTLAPDAASSQPPDLFAPAPADNFGTFDPATASDSFGGGGALGIDPFAAGTSSDPFAGSQPNPFAANTGAFGFGSFGPAVEEAPLATADPWDLSGGYLAGMHAGNMKATSPIAFTTAMLAWGYMSFPGGFKKEGQVEHLRENVKWGADYLSKVYRADPAKNQSLLVTRVGDVDTELLQWYRPEEGEARPAYAVDLNARVGSAGADVGGSVAAGLAAASVLFKNSNQPGDDEYAATLLSKAQEVYAAARPVKAAYSQADYNMSLVYNSSTIYDDLAWGAGWLYKATQDDAYLTDLYDYYVKHMQAEGDIADWKYAADWDNVFWPLNLLLAQETGKGTFKKQSEQFLRNWMCANNAANYTQRGRAFNPMTSSLGATANAAMMALMYADIAELESASAAQTYRCWGLSQLRYVLGDAGRSLVVGVGENPPQRTQDRGASCPPPPATCNRVTGLLSPDPDSVTLTGALVYGPGNSDDFLDVRNNDAAWVGIENNAGFTGALAGAVLLPSGMWEVCLQQFGIYRSNPVCGAFVAV